MQTRKSKADRTVKGKYLKDTAFLHQGVKSCGFGKLVRYSLNEKSLQYDTAQMMISFSLQFLWVARALRVSLMQRTKK